MSSARRAYDILRGYVNHGWEAIQGGPEDSEAERELREAMEQPIAVRKTEPETPAVPKEPPMSLESARKLLGVTASATSGEINAGYEELIQIANPSKFPAGAAARERALSLQRRAEAAKKVLIENIDPTIRRFEALEIE